MCYIEDAADFSEILFENGDGNLMEKKKLTTTGRVIISSLRKFLVILLKYKGDVGILREKLAAV